MFNLYIENNLIKIQTDNPTTRYLLEVTEQKNEFIPWQRKWGIITKTTKIYNEKRVKQDKNGLWNFSLGLGWAAFICNVFRNEISQETYNNFIREAILSENYRTIPFPELRDYQNDDVLHILKYKRALFSCYTGFGKTSCIAALANYAYNIGDSVLIVTPGKKANDEIVKRIKSVYGIDIPSSDGRIKNIITSGLLNRKDIKTPSELEKIEAIWSQFKWVLVDEVEYTINPSGEFLFSRLTGANHFYGFSGTADKNNAEMISFINGLSDPVIRNKDLVKYFGPSLVYRLPVNMKIDNISIKTRALNGIKFNETDFSNDQNVYQNIMSTIWTDPNIINVIEKLIGKYKRLFLPVNNLIHILNEWIDNHFLGKFRILLVCGDGYIYYDLKGNKSKLTLQEACDKINADEVDVIPSTSAGYRALDFPGLENIVLIDSLKAGQVIQYIGRCARGKHINIITLEPMNSNKTLPIFTKGNNSRKELFKNYYKYCEIIDSEIIEDNL